MSATNRIKVLSEALAPPAGTQYPEGSSLRVVSRTKRRKNDFYETPAWAVDAIVPLLPIREANAIIVDAGSGNGAIAAALEGKLGPGGEIVGVEKQEELVALARDRNLYNAEFVVGDFEKDTIEYRGAPNIIIMNPPYSRAQEFVTRALRLVARGGIVVALLRLGFLSSRRRTEFHKKHPAAFYVLNKRPSFTGDGKTDASDYAWFVWGDHLVTGQYEIINVPRARRLKRIK